MSRNLTRILMAVLVLNAIAVASAMLSSNEAHSTANDTAFAPASNATASAGDATVATADFNYIFSTVNAAPYRAATPATAATTLDFDKVFASVSAPHRMNTPPNRERLRNIGWRRILGS